MKRCPRCGQIYTDDLTYCLQDGTALLPDYPETEEVTVVRPPPDARSAGILKYAVLGLLALVVVGLGGAAGAYFVLSRFNQNSSQTRTENVSAGPTATPVVAPSVRITPSPTTGTSDPTTSEKQAELERERERLAEERRKLDEKNRSDDDEDDRDAVDAGTSRIAFRKGAASERVSGRITNARSFVLRTLNGQFLSASIRSEGDCVVFAGGSPNAGFATRQGDSRLDLRNNCDGTRRFRLLVNVR